LIEMILANNIEKRRRAPFLTNGCINLVCNA